MKEMISSLHLRSHPLDRKRCFEGEASGMPKRRRTIRNIGDGKFTESDAYCWICHCDGTGICCDFCPRLYHNKCLSQTPNSASLWVCPECQKIMMAEALETRPLSMQSISLDTLCILLKYVLQRMKLPETKPFHQPVDCGAVPSYTDYVFHPMDFATIDKNIKKRAYGSPEAFVADFKWILHNCIVFNGKNHALTAVAKTIVKMCCHEINELLICPDCYLNSCIKDSDDWFCEPCRSPHTLVWAKMKGYPFWPAKVLREDGNGQVDVRFFGEHDRAWVPLNQVFLLSVNPPSLVPKKTKGFDGARIELGRHVQLLREKNSDFKYAPDKTPFDSKKGISNDGPMHGNILDEISCSSSSDVPSTSMMVSHSSNLILPEVIKSPKTIKRKNSNKIELKRRISMRHNNAMKKRDGDSNNDELNDVRDVIDQIGSDHKNSIQHNKEHNKYEKIVLKINKMHILPKKPDEAEKISIGIIDCVDKSNDANIISFNDTKLKCHENCHDNTDNEFMSTSKGYISKNVDHMCGNLIDDVMDLECNDTTLVNDAPTLFNEATSIDDLGSSFILSDFNEAKDSLNCNDYNSLDQNMNGNVETVDNFSKIGTNNVDRTNELTDNNKSQIVSNCIILDDGKGSNSFKANIKSSNNHSNMTPTRALNCLGGISLNKYHNKLLANVQEVVSGLVDDLLNASSPNTLQTVVNDEIQKIKHFYLAELKALNHTKNLQIAEMRLFNDFEKIKMDIDKNEEISSTKLKKWCSYCLKEASLNCCPNANYCGYSCQQKHWRTHENFCTHDFI